MREKNGFPLGEELRACEQIIQEEGVLLQMSVTGAHYKISQQIHTPNAYSFFPIFETGPNREQFGSRVLEVMEEQDLDPRRDINVLVATSAAAVQFACTLQHFRAMRHTRNMYVERGRNGKVALGHGFLFRPDDKVVVVHFAGASFNGLRGAIDAIQRFGEETGTQPCIMAVVVLIDRSPAGSGWEQDFIAFKRIVAVRSPLIAYPVMGGQCSLCREGVPLVDLSGAI